MPACFTLSSLLLICSQLQTCTGSARGARCLWEMHSEVKSWGDRGLSLTVFVPRLGQEIRFVSEPQTAACANVPGGYDVV